tara:strand:+ start:317 stop:787 length:471 start_codon:yes stop_codon:yes gene_type:complete
MQSGSTTTSSASELKVAIITSSYHDNITSELSRGAETAFLEAGGLPEHCIHVQAAGAWELPVLAKQLSQLNQVDAIVALGCIITGETTHDQVIGNAIAQGLMNISLDWANPVSMGVLTCQTIEQAESRSSSTSSNKGREAMRAAINTAVTLKEFRQ